MMQRQSLPSIVTLTEIEEIVSSDSFALRLIDAIKKGFISYSNGGFNACPIQTMGAPPMAPFSGYNNSSSGGGGGNYQAQTCVKSGYVTGASHYVIKVASGGHPFPNNSGLMQLYSQSTGKLETILLDEGILTDLRTAAVGAVAAQILAPDILLRTENNHGCIGVLGTGIQARYQLQYLAHVIKCRNVKVWGRTKENVQKYIQDMELDGWKVSPVDTPQDLLTDCSLIVTTTSSREPLLHYTGNNSIQHPLHITCVGSDATGKMELDPKLVANADLLVADCKLVTSERGEFEDALKQKLVSLDNVVELGKLIERKELHRQRNTNGEEEEDCRLTIFDSSGVAVQDCVIAAMVNEALVQKGA
jgi:ornithine cyclodeaminase